MFQSDLDAYRDEIVLLINQDLTLSEIAARTGCGYNTLIRWKKSRGVKSKHSTGPRQGPKAKGWKGGVRLTHAGYVEVYMPWHPACTEANAQRKSNPNDRAYNRKKYIQLHRLVVENHLQRFLDPREVVHHRDDDPTNNDIANLELFSSNADHLSCSLAGKCPNWTQEGIHNLQLSTSLRHDIGHFQSTADAPEYTRDFHRLKKQLDTSARIPSRMADGPEREQVLSRSKQILRNLTWFPRLSALHQDQGQI